VSSSTEEDVGIRGHCRLSTIQCCHAVAEKQPCSEKYLKEQLVNSNYHGRLSTCEALVIGLHPCFGAPSFNDVIKKKKKKKRTEINERVRERTVWIARGMRDLESMSYMERLKENFSKVF